MKKHDNDKGSTNAAKPAATKPASGKPSAGTSEAQKAVGESNCYFLFIFIVSLDGLVYVNL